MTERRSLRFLLATLSGVLLGASFPYISAGPLIFLALVPLVVAVVSASGLFEAFLLGLAGYAISWMIQMPWVIVVMSQYGGLSRPVGTVIYFALCLTLGFFAGAFFAVPLRWLRPGPRLRDWAVIPALWVAVELGRTYLLFGGFPWNPLSAALIDVRPLIMVDRWFGPFFMSCMIMIPTTVIAWAVKSEASTRAKGRCLAGTALFLLLWAGTGEVLLHTEERQIASEPKHLAALLQPNITQEMRWTMTDVSELFGRMSEMTLRAIASKAEVIVWPESTIPVTYLTTDFYRDWIEAESRDSGADIILGSVAEDPAVANRVWNSAYLVTGGKTTARYDKIKLVPFGEYVPLRRLLFFARKLVRAVGEFEFGASDLPMRGRFAYGPAICYEIVYPAIPRTQVRHGADVLVTITNDAWFDTSAAPRQHLNNARMRAIETSRYLLRAATTGISAVVDPTGRVVEELPVHRQGIIFARFATRHSITAYVRFGDWLAFAAVLAAAGRLAFCWRRRSPAGPELEKK